MRKSAKLRYIVYSAEIAAAYIIQVIPGIMPELFGGKGLPLAAVAVVISVSEEELPSVVIGAVCGLLTDLSYSGGICYYGIALSVMCFLISMLYKEYIRKSLFTVLAVSGAVCTAVILVQFMLFYMAAGYPDAGSWFVRHYLSRIIYTIAFVPVFYWLNGLMYRKSTVRRRDFMKER